MRFETIPELLTAEQCKAIIDAARPKLERATVQQNGGQEVNLAYRDAQHCQLEDDALTLPLRRAASEFANRPISHCEPTEVVMYRPDGFFAQHHDGQNRIASMVVFLNENYEGGALVFPYRTASYEPKTGKAIVWDNYENGQPAVKAQHSCARVLSGFKWIAIQWVRAEPLMLDYTPAGALETQTPWEMTNHDFHFSFQHAAASYRLSLPVDDDKYFHAIYERPFSVFDDCLLECPGYCVLFNRSPKILCVDLNGEGDGILIPPGAMQPVYFKNDHYWGSPYPRAHGQNRGEVDCELWVLPGHEQATGKTLAVGGKLEETDGDSSE